jgi:hypothetical protein
MIYLIPNIVMFKTSFSSKVKAKYTTAND